MDILSCRRNEIDGENEQTNNWDANWKCGNNNENIVRSYYDYIPFSWIWISLFMYGYRRENPLPDFYLGIWFPINFFFFGHHSYPARVASHKPFLHRIFISRLLSCAFIFTHSHQHVFSYKFLFMIIMSTVSFNCIYYFHVILFLVEYKLSRMKTTSKFSSCNNNKKKPWNINKYSNQVKMSNKMIMCFAS